METGDEEVSINLLFCDDVPGVEFMYLEFILVEPVWPSGKALSPFLTGRMFVRRTYFGQFDEL